ncbi:ATP-binding protein [Collimonas pratensis]|uniref:histidine kinase n=2 Tax=Collimonas pratensis TaxID=279113 RepID=A0ABN4M482_9BURK|nr:ATP-binding protein [Collimonas pratensis]AMP12418.1 histidine kinase-, DNA gyrase B-, and HSP90-like ATPase family protein [Collimonas pratensis]NKI70952.1 sensor histidine kinase [Collimonas pratensis]
MDLLPLFSTLPQHQILSRLIWMRWIAILAQLLVIAVVHFTLDVGLSAGALKSLFGVIGVLAVFNLLSWRRTRRVRPAGDLELFVQLLADVTSLSLLLYFSGGATNPFVSFYLPALAVAAAILPWRLAFVLALYAFASYSLLTYVYQPLHIHDSSRGMAYHLAGMWVNFAVSAALITWFVTRISANLRQREAQLGQARERQLQGERMVALGAQAASAAHEMGTPLATIAVIAGELRNEARQSPALAAYGADLALIEQQIGLCKNALERMRVDAEPQAALGPHALKEWLAKFIEAWRLRYPAVKLSLTLPEQDGKSSQVQVLGQVLLTLLDNAARAVAANGGRIQVTLTFAGASALIRVQDDGAGIAAELLPRLGYQPVASSAVDGKGIGLLLAFENARQIGAEIRLSTPSAGTGTIADFTLELA